MKFLSSLLIFLNDFYYIPGASKVNFYNPCSLIKLFPLWLFTLLFSHVWKQRRVENPDFMCEHRCVAWRPCCRNWDLSSDCPTCMSQGVLGTQRVSDCVHSGTLSSSGWLEPHMIVGCGEKCSSSQNLPIRKSVWRAFRAVWRGPECDREQEWHDRITF